MNIGRAIKLCRSQKSLTQIELAQKAGLSVSYLSLLEKNRRDPSISTIRDISLALGIPTSVLFFLAADKSELSGLESELIEKLSFAALTFLRESGGTSNSLL